ncbi:hypothetical protein CYMTET_10832 [Cymbomonas tetramitiformis]|uniref:Uncharacterized protein n=1 Tax=Cymbomonas tetramitiformis TaxID=36881 RepID=A0AAE0LDL6_9CHLO|nr:hypothetical protein CYMTET_10832 [Cymbomonas tetramitiformis]
MSEEEKQMKFKCTIRDFSAAHKKSDGSPPSQAFQVQEMGPTGTEVYKYFRVESDVLCEMGRHRGKYAAEFQCVIKSCDDSGFCGAKRTIYHQAGKAASTSNLVTHVRDMAKKCDVHMLALAAIERNSSKFVEVGGEQVKVFNFSESFEHHVDLLWLRTIGLSFNMTTKDEFRDYVRGFEPRAAFPHSQTIYRLAVCVLELQKTERLERTSRLIKVYVGKACVGLQLDMWTDTSTHTAFAAITQTTIEDPGEELDAEYAQLFLRSEILDFDVFPLCAKTGPNIRTWFARVLERNNLPYSAISGVTPDGAADGHCALNMIPEISEKVDTCILHSMQRGVLYSIGLAGKGNQFKQLKKNCTLRPGIDACLEKYKLENKNNKEAIIETNEDEQGSKVGNAVAASEIGLDLMDWDKSQEVEGLLSYPFDIKETIESSGICTGSHAMILLHDLKEAFCDNRANLEVGALPATLKLEDRERSRVIRKATDLSSMVTTARSVLKDELQARLFDSRPSNMRLIQCFMSKQVDCKTFLRPEQYELAKTLYLTAIREAAIISGKVAGASVAMGTTSQPAKKKQKTMLFRGRSSLPAEDPTAEIENSEAGIQGDVVLNEIHRWENLPETRLQQFYREDGLINEFMLFWQLRFEFPLHLIVFKQTASHLPHEANCENVFSRAGHMSDPNLDPSYLGILTTVGVNKASFKPSVSQIRKKYFELYAGKGEGSEGSE